jgi:hypothetical protein
MIIEKPRSVVYPRISRYRDPLLDARISCHETGIAHLGIKPEKVCFHSDGREGLGDFGCSRGVDQEVLISLKRRV